MKLNELPFYKPLIWAIKKYCSKKMPDGNQTVTPSCNPNDKSYRKNVDSTLYYSESVEGEYYWSEIHSKLIKVYKEKYYFDLMILDYKKNNKNGNQLDFDFS